MEKVIPLEKQDPFLAEELQKIANGAHSSIKSLRIADDIHYVPRALQSTKIKRNDPCPCGSGKKYKKCCL